MNDREFPGPPWWLYAIVISMFLMALARYNTRTREEEKLPPPSSIVVEQLKLDTTFYKKYADADGFPVVGSEKVSDAAMREAAYLVGKMLEGRDDLKQAMIRRKCRLIVMAYNEYTSDVPEHKWLKPHKQWDRRARGLGGSKTDVVASCAEENLLGYPSDPYKGENILIHEFSHLIHHHGIAQLDTTFSKRLGEVYRKALQAGLWQGTYAATNQLEYFAEGVQSWFNTNQAPNRIHNHVDTRRELKEYDPGLAKLIEEVFGDKEWRYVNPRDRAEKEHLEGYDFTNQPTFYWRQSKEKEENDNELLQYTPRNEPLRVFHHADAWGKTSRHVSTVP